MTPILENNFKKMVFLKQNKHFYFDEEGNIINNNDKNSDKFNFNKLNLISSSEENIISYCKEFDEIATNTQKFVDNLFKDFKLEEDEFYKTPYHTKKKRKQIKNNVGLPQIVKENKDIKKYWLKRFRLFSKFDEGIELDYESWFSVTPEKIAQHTAERCKCNIVVDAFCGAGGNTIQFALNCKKVIAIDIDPNKIKLAKHNAKIYGVRDKIEFIAGDFFQIYKSLKADMVFLSPPWGGPSYLQHDIFDIEKMLPFSANYLMEITKEVSPNIAIYLPKNTNLAQLAVLAGAGNNVELEKNYLGDQLVAITAYYGNLINN